MRRIAAIVLVALGLVQGATLTVNGRQYYVNGINVPWNQFGSDVGSHPQWGHLYSSSWFETFCSACQTSGVNAARLWIHCDGRSSPEFDGTGVVTGLDATFLPDLADIFARALSHNVMLMPCLWSFDMTGDGASSAGPYAGLHANLITDTVKTRSYITNALLPIVQQFRNAPNLLGWEIINEPEWSVNDIEDGGGTTQTVTADQMKRFCGMIASAIHRNSANLVTVGSACLKWSSPRNPPAVIHLWGDAALRAACGGDTAAHVDFYQIHYYDWMYNADWGYDPFQLSPAKTPAYWQLDKPTLVGESPAKAGNYTVTQMLDNCFANGYCGIFPWSYWGGDGAGDWPSVRSQLKAFRDAHAALVDFQLPTVVPAAVRPASARPSGPAICLPFACRLPDGAVWGLDGRAVARPGRGGVVFVGTALTPRHP